MTESTTLGPRDIAARLRQAGQMLRLRGENAYRAGAYEMGAEIVEGAADILPELLAGDRLTELRGIGPSLAAVITELARTGRSAALDRIMGDLPAGLLEVARLPGMTLRRIQILHDQLGITSAADLRGALAAGAVEAVRGFGPATVAKLREALARPAEEASGLPARWVLVDVLEAAERLLPKLRRVRGVAQVEIVGSVRRAVETAGDLNLLCASESPELPLRALAEHAAVAAVEARGPHACRVRLIDGLRVTLAVEPPLRFGAALLTSTGSKAHVARLAARAAARGFALETLEGPTEADLYARLGLPFIPPELREDAGEIEAADAGDDFGDLITEGDVRGMVHCHTVHSDGRHTVAQMAAAAAALKMEYITITDHSPTASYAGGLTEERLRDQWPEIAAAREQTGVVILRGTESDILSDGRLDFSDEVLGALDVVIASVHQRYKLDRAGMTQRIVRAMQHPCFKIWGHALGRLLLRREPIDCDVDRILDTIAASRAAIEVNGSPWRLDLPPEWIRPARRRGIKFVISVDAHSTSELGHLRFGVAMARRGGLRRGDVLNTLSAAEFAAAVRP